MHGHLHLPRSLAPWPGHLHRSTTVTVGHLHGALPAASASAAALSASEGARPRAASGRTPGPTRRVGTVGLPVSRKLSGKPPLRLLGSAGRAGEWPGLLWPPGPGHCGSAAAAPPERARGTGTATEQPQSGPSHSLAGRRRHPAVARQSPVSRCVNSGSPDCGRRLGVECKMKWLPLI